MYPMLGVQSGLCFHSNPTDQFLSEPLGRRLLLEIEISGWHGHRAVAGTHGCKVEQHWTAWGKGRGDTPKYLPSWSSTKNFKRFDTLWSSKMQYCAVGVESHNDSWNPQKAHVTSHIGHVWIPRKSLWFPSFIILPPSIPPLHLGHRTFLNRCRPLLHDDLHGDIWAQLGTCPGNFQQPSRIAAKNPGFQSYTWPPASFHKTEIQWQETGPAAKPFPQRPSLHAVSRWVVLRDGFMHRRDTRCAGLRTPNLRVSHSYEIGQLFDSASKFKQPNWGNKKAWINRYFRWSTSTLLNDWC